MLKRLRDSLNGFELNRKSLSKEQLIIFLAVLFLTLILKFVLIPFNMIDHGEGASRTWNALWWAEKPFFIMPLSGNPGWFYFMGPLIMITREIFYTPITVMILSVTLAGVYLFRITYLISGFKNALLSYFIFTLNPVLFRLNYTPVPQQLYLASACIMIYYFLKASCSKDERMSRKYFTIAGVFSFVGLTFRPEALFVIFAFCVMAAAIGKKGAYRFIVLSLLFQLIWITISYFAYGTFFKTFEAVRDYDVASGYNLASAGILPRLRGFMLPYFFIVVGTTVILFYFFLRGLLISYKKYPFLLFLILFFPVLVPAFINGLWETMSSLYDTTRYFYLTFYFCSVFTALGLGAFISRFKQNSVQAIVSALIILTAIPLSYIKEFLPVKYKKLFPKVVEFIVTTEDPADARALIKFIDANIDAYPALIFDPEGSDSSILYLPFRTKLPPPEKVLISGYNIPNDKDSLTARISTFMKNNPKGLIIFHKDQTLMNRIFIEAVQEQNLRGKVTQKEETVKWLAYTYE